MLHHLTCFFLLLAWTNADYQADKMIGCDSRQHRRGSLSEFGNQPNDTELIDFNTLLGDFLSTILDQVEIPHHLIFNCTLAKNRESIHNPRKSFGVSQVTKIKGDGAFDITSLADLFTGVAREVIVGIEKLPKPKCFGISECFGTRKKTYIFGCDYTVHNAAIMTKCAFERRKATK